ncbi:MAG: hypothetical protein OHK0052_06900 [Anaerolineales bacterium]
MTLPKMFGKYQLLQKLGEGATAEVFLARDTLDREVAIKILKRVLLADAQSFERFQLEARGMAKLHHMHIADVFDMDTIEEQQMIVMRYIPGHSLTEALRTNGRLPWQTALQLLRDIGDALDYAHSKNFLHRDIKPSNIMMTPEGRFVLTDFGLIRAMMSTGLTPHTGALLGTPPYMAPEIWLGKPAVPASDQYALACVFYEALTGSILFSGPNPPAIMTNHVMKGAQFIFPADLDLPPGLPGVLEHALQKDPTERYPTCTAFSLAVQNLPTAAEEQARQAAELEAKRLAEQQARQAAELEAKRLAEQQARQAAELEAKRLAEQQARQAAELSQDKNEEDPVAAAKARLKKLSELAFESQTHEDESPTSVGVPFGDDKGRGEGRAGGEGKRLPSPPGRGVGGEGVRGNPKKSSLPRLPAWTIAALVLGILFAAWYFTNSPTAQAGLTWVTIPAGEFEMGSTNGDSDERPVHTVFLDAYQITTHEITNRQYAQCVQAGACTPPNALASYTRASYYDNADYANYPVIYVNWEQARAFCQWVGGDLPTEAQWEKAARGGLKSNVYPWGNTFDSTRANFCDRNCSLDWANKSFDDGYADTAPVGSYPPNDYGLYDMSGNVWEWVRDFYAAEYYQTSPYNNPLGPSSGKYRVVRGGAWNSNGVQSPCRQPRLVSSRSYALQYRVSMSPLTLGSES